MDRAIHEILGDVQTIGETFASNPRLETVLEGIIRSGMRLAAAEGGSVMLLSEDGRELVVAAAVGPRAAMLLGTRQPASASIAGLAIRSEGHVLVKGVADSENGPRSDHPQELSWGLVVPLRVSNRLLGVLNINTGLEDGQLPRERVSVLSILANQAAIMIEVARLYLDLSRKERRLELFVDKFLRIQGEQRELTLAVAPEDVRPAPRPPDSSSESTLRRLSGRELEVLHLMVEGLTNKEIGARLYLSPDTVKNHVVQVIEKLGVSDRTQAAVFAIRQGLVA